MKLYNLPRGERFKLLENPTIPPVAPQGKLNVVYKLLGLDGMYCNCLNPEQERVYFAAWTEVEIAE
jgi:hypothetical protein